MGGYDFDYTPDTEDEREAIIDFLIRDTGKDLTDNEYAVVSNILRKMIDDLDIQDQLGDMYYDDLKEYFEDEAMESER